MDETLNPYADLEDADLPTLLEHAWELRQEKKALEADIERVNQALTTRLGQQRSFATDELTVKVVRQKPRLKVKTAEQVPEQFLSLQPDKKRLQAHFAETGEIVQGTSLSTPSSYLVVRQKRD